MELSDFIEIRAREVEVQVARLARTSLPHLPGHVPVANVLYSFISTKRHMF